jgi:hypothetical protein
LIRPVRLFRVARRLAEQSIDNNGHDGSGRIITRIRYLRARLLRRKALFYRRVAPGS